MNTGEHLHSSVLVNAGECSFGLLCTGEGYLGEVSEWFCYLTVIPDEATVKINESENVFLRCGSETFPNSLDFCWVGLHLPSCQDVTKKSD